MRGFVYLIVLLFSLPIFANQFVFDKNVTSEVKTQMLNDLNFIYQVELSRVSPLHTKIFGKFVKDKTYRSFFTSRVKKVGYDSTQTSAMAYVQIFNPNKMYFALNFVKFKVPQVSRVLTMYHESRHTEYSKGNWTHATCPMPFIGEDGKEVVGETTGIKLAGLDACDTTELGAYALGGILLNNLSKFCSNCTEKVKMDANFYAEAARKRIIDAGAQKRLKVDYQAR